MNIDIIIPNFNGSNLIEKNLPKVIEAAHRTEGKIIIVDDGSNKIDRENLEEVIGKIGSKKVKLIVHPKNKGFASAVNTGVRASNAEFIVLLNSDVTPKSDFLVSPSRYFSEEKLAAVGCLDISFEQGKKVNRGRGIAYWKKGMLYHEKGDEEKTDTFWVSGGSSIIRRDVFMLVGGMDEIYNPFYWEDIDLSYKIQKAGYSIVFDANSIVEHHHDEGAIKSNFSENRITSIAYRNQFIFIWKNITDKKLLMNHILRLPVHITAAALRFDVNFIKGLFLAALKLPAIMYKRKKQKKFYKISDAEIIKYIS